MNAQKPLNEPLPLMSGSDLLDGELAKVKLDDNRHIALCRVGESVYAFDDMCSHGTSSLSDEGELDGFTVICGWHAGAFDIRSGRAVSAPCTKAIRTYRVGEINGDICLLPEEVSQ